MPQKKYLPVCNVVNTHGIKGDTKVKLLCDDRDVFDSIKTVYTDENATNSLKIAYTKPLGDMLIVKFEGINDINQALCYKGKMLFADRNDIKKDDGSFFIADLIGLDIININNGEKLGVLADVDQNPAHDIYVIKSENGTHYVPVVKEFVKEIDLEKGIFISPIEGMF